jgi:hypothetical protein
MPRPALVPFLTAATLLLVVVAYRAQHPARPAPPSAPSLCSKLYGVY